MHGYSILNPAVQEHVINGLIGCLQQETDAYCILCSPGELEGNLWTQLPPPLKPRNSSWLRTPALNYKPAKFGNFSQKALEIKKTDCCCYYYRNCCSTVKIMMHTTECWKLNLCLPRSQGGKPTEPPGS